MNGQLISVRMEAIKKVLRVHSGEDFTVDDFPTAEEGREAWEAFRKWQPQDGWPLPPVADAYRIEADCAMRDYDGLELDFGIVRRALEEIAAGRPNRTFDPWARDLARSALSEVKHD